MNSQRLQTLLERAYQEHHSLFSRDRDPVSRAHRYSVPADQEVAGFLAALLAYGNVTSILKSVDRILKSLGPSPALAVQEGNFPKKLRDFRHRFTTGEDLEVVLSWMGSALNSHGSLESFFIADNPPAPMQAWLNGFVLRFTSQPLSPRLKRMRERRERQLKYLISEPQRGSACKRLNLFLRWMVRPADGIDLGIWKTIPASALILPLDTHLLKTIQFLGWTQSKQASWKTAEAATERLRQLCPEDPTRYDFSLCHLSMHSRGLKTLLSAG